MGIVDMHCIGQVCNNKYLKKLLFTLLCEHFIVKTKHHFQGSNHKQ